MSEIWDERTLSKKKPLIALLLVELNRSEDLKLLHPLHQLNLNDFRNVRSFSIDQLWNEASHGLLPIEDCHVPHESEPP